MWLFGIITRIVPFAARIDATDVMTQSNLQDILSIIQQAIGS